MLSQRGQIEVRVFYTWEKDAAEYDKDFGKKIEWDIPLLEGYDHVFVSNEVLLSWRPLRAFGFKKPWRPL